MEKTMQKFIVGCDYDGVLTNLTEYYEVTGKKFFKKNPVNINEYSIKKMFDISPFSEIRYGLKYFFDYCQNAKMRDGMSELLNKIINDDGIVHAITARKFVTSRNFFGNKSREMVKKYAAKHNIKFKTYEFCSETYAPRDKLIACNKLGVDLMIEDTASVAINLANNNIKVALVDTLYNQGIEHKNIRRCKSVLEIENYINEIKEKIEPKNEKFLELKNKRVNSIDFNKGKKIFMILYPIITWFTLTPFFTKVLGKEKIPYQDGFIIASNHLTSTDQYKVGYALGNRYVSGYMASTVKKTFRGKLFQLTNSAIFINRKNDDSKHQAKEEFDMRLVSGMTMLIFPEGTRKNNYKEHKNKKILPFKLGAVSSAKNTGSAILPVCITKKFLFSVVEFGDVIFVKHDDDLENKNKELENIILSMIDKRS